MERWKLSRGFFYLGIRDHTTTQHGATFTCTKCLHPDKDYQAARSHCTFRHRRCASTYIQRYHSAMSQDTRLCSSKYIEQMMIHPNSSGLFIEEGDFDSQFELRRNYKESVKCVVACETIVDALCERLESKDDWIVYLEKKLVEMSFELASLKAFADEHRSKRRFTCGCSCADATTSSSRQADPFRNRVGNSVTSPRQVTSNLRPSTLPVVPLVGIHELGTTSLPFATQEFRSLELSQEE
jgi:hypothetical protein